MTESERANLRARNVTIMRLRGLWANTSLITNSVSRFAVRQIVDGELAKLGVEPESTRQKRLAASESFQQSHRAGKLPETSNQA
jgi:hypothetical protein